ncbi:hypothetical protein D3C85_1194300 [compost metagenome]
MFYDEWTLKVRAATKNDPGGQVLGRIKSVEKRSLHDSQFTNLPGAADESAEGLRAWLIEQRDERRCARYIVRDGADDHVRVTVQRDLRGQSNTDAVASSDQHHHGFVPGNIFGSLGERQRGFVEPAMNDIVST